MGLEKCRVAYRIFSGAGNCFKSVWYSVKVCGTVHPCREKENTVEPLYNGHIGTDHFVHYREVVLFQRYCHYIHVGWCVEKCPLYSGVLYQRFHCNGRVTLYQYVSYFISAYGLT